MRVTAWAFLCTDVVAYGDWPPTVAIRFRHGRSQGCFGDALSVEHPDTQEGVAPGTGARQSATSAIDDANMARGMAGRWPNYALRSRPLYGSKHIHSQTVTRSVATIRNEKTAIRVRTRNRIKRQK